VRTVERDLVQLANMVATDAGHKAIALLVDERGIVADDLWRWLIKQGAAR
jgi:hypothetical protein